MSTQEHKALLRRELRERLQSVDFAAHVELRRQLVSWLVGQSGTWGAYWPLPGEPDLRPLWTEVKSITWVFPRIDQAHLNFHGPVLNWVQGPFGITEPSPETPIVERDGLQGVLIPGLGFDRSGGRLGRGKGFYDRWLQGWNGLRVGVGFDTQWIPLIPVEKFDQHVDLVMTESGLYRPDRNGV